MSAFKGTPGPWGVYVGKSGVLNIGASHNCTVAVICASPIGDREANARLIAAAPELLEALVDAVEYLQHHLPDEVLAPHRAAIAKATGGES